MTSAARRAVERVDFQLSYRRSRLKRRFHPTGLTGEAIPCAYQRGQKQSGEWMADFPDWSDPEVTEDEWIQAFFRVAVSEAIHEALEWFQVDGKALLDPHGPRLEEDILNLSGEFADRLYRLARQEARDHERTPA